MQQIGSIAYRDKHTKEFKNSKPLYVEQTENNNSFLYSAEKFFFASITRKIEETKHKDL